MICNHEKHWKYDKKSKPNLLSNLQPHYQKSYLDKTTSTPLTLPISKNAKLINYSRHGNHTKNLTPPPFLTHPNTNFRTRLENAHDNAQHYIQRSRHRYWRVYKVISIQIPSINFRLLDYSWRLIIYREKDESIFQPKGRAKKNEARNDCTTLITSSFQRTDNVQLFNTLPTFRPSIFINRLAFMTKNLQTSERRGEGRGGRGRGGQRGRVKNRAFLSQRLMISVLLARLLFPKFMAAVISGHFAGNSLTHGNIPEWLAFEENGQHFSVIFYKFHCAVLYVCKLIIVV